MIVFALLVFALLVFALLVFAFAFALIVFAFSFSLLVFAPPFNDLRFVLFDFLKQILFSTQTAFIKYINKKKLIIGIKTSIYLMSDIEKILSNKTTNPDNDKCKFICKCFKI